jgi:putative ABC transport system permease protein
VLIQRQSADRDSNDEVEHYLQQAADAGVANGLSPEQARRAARLELGSPTAIHEQVRSYGWEHTLHTLFTDLHYAARQLTRNPTFALVTGLTLALGIGASTAIFSAVNPILFKPLPYPHAAQLMMIWEMRNNGSAQPVTFGTFHGLHERSRSFETMAVMKPWQPAMAGDGLPERFEGQRVSADYFRTLEISPVLGRDFQAADDQFHGPDVVILSDRLWRLRFAADRTIVGRQLKLDDTLFTVIGVMPSAFENVLAAGAELWAPLQYDPSLPADSRDWGHHLRMVARLGQGVSRDQARNELDAILHPFTQTYAKGYENSGGPPDGMLVNRLQDDLTLGVKPALLAILGAAGLVLLIVCVNVTNLLLALGVRRRNEFGMRAALGAGRVRMIRQYSPKVRFSPQSAALSVWRLRKPVYERWWHSVRLTYPASERFMSTALSSPLDWPSPQGSASSWVCYRRCKRRVETQRVGCNKVQGRPLATATPCAVPWPSRKSHSHWYCW